MLLSDMMEAARKEQGYPEWATNWEGIIYSFQSEKDKVLFEDENGFLAAQFTYDYLLMHGASVAILVSWYVTPDKRGTGLGKELYNKFYKMAREKGCDYILQGPSTGDDCIKVGEFHLRKID